MTREEAIDFGKMWLELQEDSKGSSTYEFFKTAIKALEQEPKTGHWIKIVVNKQHKIKCNKCNYIEDEYITHIRNFCPSCGVKMIESQESEG